MQSSTSIDKLLVDGKFSQVFNPLNKWDQLHFSFQCCYISVLAIGRAQRIHLYSNVHVAGM